MKITKDKFVAIHYTLKDKDGVQIDSSEGLEPLGYVQGRGYLIPGLEAQLEGKAPGDKFSCTIQPKDGYGERDERLVAELSRDRFDFEAEIEVGMHFQVETPAGPTVVTVTEVNGDRVKIDGNHEMAGKILNFDIEVVEVRDTTPEELAQLEANSGCGGCGGCGGGNCDPTSCGGCGEGGCGEGNCGQ